MQYRCETTLPDVELIVSGLHVGTIPDLDVVMVLDEDGDLAEVEIPGVRQSIYGDRRERLVIDARSSNTNAVCIWKSANNHFTHNRADIQDRAGVPKVYTHEFRSERLPSSVFI